VYKGHWSNDGSLNVAQEILMVAGSASRISMSWIWAIASVSVAFGASLNVIVIVGKLLDDGTVGFGVSADDCLIAPELRVQTDVLKNRKSRICASITGAVAVQIVEIAGLEPVLVKKILLRHVLKNKPRKLSRV